MAARIETGSEAVERLKENAGSKDKEWIAASHTRNYMLKDPVLDWLKCHTGGGSRKRPFVDSILQQGIEFEERVIDMMKRRLRGRNMVDIDAFSGMDGDSKVEETFDAMARGVPMIYSGLLRDYETKTYGIPDLLVRSDWINRLTKKNYLTEEESKRRGTYLSGDYHYIVLDIKHSTLSLRCDGVHLLNSGSMPAYKSQMYIYNRALAKLQGYDPGMAFVLGKRWKYTSMGMTCSGESCFDRLGVVDYRGLDLSYVERTDRSVEWLRDCRSPEAARWNISKVPLEREELYPNMCNGQDAPWRAEKVRIADNIEEITKVWNVGVKHRKRAHKRKVYSWTDPKCTPQLMRIDGERGATIDGIMKINRSSDNLLLPKTIDYDVDTWGERSTIEFFVDFETVNGVFNNFDCLPMNGGMSMIFMIGVGYIDPENGRWTYKEYTTKSLKYREEARICREFSTFVANMGRRYKTKKPLCFHWTNAEPQMWNNAFDRHANSGRWKAYRWDWYDLYDVFVKEPIVIKGCFNFRLKDVAKAMKTHGYIETDWNGGSVYDGLGAMTAAWKANEAAEKHGVSMSSVPEMRSVASYNEVDVKVLYEIITYLRKNRLSKKRKRVDDFSRPAKRRRIR